jgi:hypothetical protein
VRYLAPGDPYRSAPDDGIRRRPVLSIEDRADLAWLRFLYGLCCFPGSEDLPDGEYFLAAFLAKRS